MIWWWWTRYWMAVFEANKHVHYTTTSNVIYVDFRRSK